MSSPIGRLMLSAVGAFLVPWIGGSSALAEPVRPNIVFLYADDLGYGDVACLNPKSKIATPNLDRLAKQGMRFTDAHSSSGICSPSRYALLTGRYHWRKFHGIVNSFGPSVISDQELTLPEMLKQAGYQTACIGKWHLGWDWDAIKVEGAMPDGKKGFAPSAFDWQKAIPDGPTAHGFDYYFGDDVPNFPPYTWIENDRVVTAPTESLIATPETAEGAWEARPGPMASGWQLDQVMPTLTKRAVDWIDDRRGQQQPFFLYFPFTSPHAPIVPTEEFRGKSQAGGYGDFVLQTDWTVGQILDALDRNGFSKNTLVVFTSDNGPEHYAYDRIKNFSHRSSGELRGLKRDIFEGGHRVPLIVRWPGEIAEGGISAALISQVDIFSTLAAIVDQPLPDFAASDSINAIDVWRGKQTTARTSIVHNTNPNSYAIREGNWVLVDAKSGNVTKVPAWFDEDNHYEANTFPAALFDLSNDLPQRHNLYAAHPQRVSQLRALLATIRNQGEREQPKR
jgi:arylsulfatase A